MKRTKHFLVAILAVPSLLSGCASIEGSQRRVLGTPASMALVNEYPLGTALENFGQDSDEFRDGLSKQAYRDTVVMVYMNAIDARYHDFRTALGSEGREAALGLDLAVLGFTGWASVAKESIVNELSAIASGFAGTRAAVDKNLYFDKALPALIASMDAERLRVAAHILKNLERTAAEYPLVLALGDLSRYEMAGSLDLAIHQVTSQAAEDREEAKAEFEDAVRACDSEEDLVANRTTIMKWVVGRQIASPPDIESLQSLAGKMGIGVAENSDAALHARALRTAIQNDLVQNYCSNAKLTELINAVRGTDWGSGM